MVPPTETFWTLLHNPAHWEFELFLMILFDGVIGWLCWPFIKKHWNHHVARDKREATLVPVPVPVNKVYMFATSRSPLTLEARLYSERGNGTYFKGTGRTDAEALGSLVCHCPEKFNAQFILDCEGPEVEV